MKAAAVHIPGLPSRFQVQHEIGHGGMARVYLAYDAVTNTRVALKILLDHLRSDALIVERFRREIAAVRRISHPNVVAIHELIETPEILCLVQEYHPGIDLKRWIRRQERLEPDHVVHVAIQVLDALEAAHRQGIIHRDIKPHNILVTDDLDTRVVDFGLARVDDLVGLTTHTMSVGTPEYMAPEIMISQVVDGRADLYALGVTMYEALTGKLPYTAATPLALMKMHHDGSPPEVAALAPHVPDFLAHIVLRAMQTEPEDRFSTAAEMAQALRERKLEATAEFSDVQCPSCGAALVPGLTVCVECGHEVVRIREQDGSNATVAIVAKRFVFSEEDADYLTYEEKTRLIETLEGMGAESAFSVKKTDRLLRLFPLVIASGLTDRDAEYLESRLKDIGMPVRLYPDTISGLIRKFVDFQEPMLWVKRLFIMMLTVSWALAFAVEKFGPLALIPAALALGVWWILRYFHRLQPVVRFTGERGYALSNDALALRARDVFETVRSPRIRRLLHRILSRGIALRRQVESAEWAPTGMDAEIDELLMSSLSVAERSGILDDRAVDFDVREVMERIARLDERLTTSHDAREVDHLINEKVQLTSLLAQNDDRQNEIARLSAKLLGVCSELDAMALSLDHIDSQTGESVSMILRSLNADVDAVGEIELGLYDVGIAEHAHAESRA